MIATSAIIIVFMVWASFPTSESSSPLRIPLGRKLLIPCISNENHSESFSWFYSTNNVGQRRTQIFHEDKSGLHILSNNLWHRKNVLRNRSLEISPFTEEDQGIYSCELYKNDKITYGLSTSVVLEKESHTPVITTVSGSGFMHEVTKNVITSTYYALDSALNNTTNKSIDSGPTPPDNGETQWLASTVAGVSAAVCLFLVALALFILCCFKWRILTASANQLLFGGQGTSFEEEITLVYSSLVIRRLQQRDYIRNDNECVYSHIRVQQQNDTKFFRCAQAHTMPKCILLLLGMICMLLIGLFYILCQKVI